MAPPGDSQTDGQIYVGCGEGESPHQKILSHLHRLATGTLIFMIYSVAFSNVLFVLFLAQITFQSPAMSHARIPCPWLQLFFVPFIDKSVILGQVVRPFSKWFPRAKTHRLLGRAGGTWSKRRWVGPKIWWGVHFQASFQAGDDLTHRFPNGSRGSKFILKHIPVFSLDTSWHLKEVQKCLWMSGSQH